jgi:AcrR family transcriptional regulator
MAEPDIPDSGRRGRPRSEQARLAILAAAAELLSERGLHSMSANDIAVRAGVSKATIYRWWSSKQAVALDAFLAELESHQEQFPDTGSLRGDLVASLDGRCRLMLEHPALAHTQAALLAQAQADAGLRAEYLAHVLGPLRQHARAMFERAAARGEIERPERGELVLDLLYGALYHRLFNAHAPLGPEFVEDAVNLVVRGL